MNETEIIAIFVVLLILSSEIKRGYDIKKMDKELKKLKEFVDELEEISDIIDGLGIDRIPLEPREIDRGRYEFVDKNFTWQYGEKYDLSCSLHVVCDEDFKYTTVVDNIKIWDDYMKNLEITKKLQKEVEFVIKDAITIIRLIE